MPYRLIVIGASKGGLTALKTILAALPAGFPLAVAIVLHREKGADERLVSLLAQYGALSVKEVEDKEPIEPGHVFLAPADYHLLAEEGHFSLSIDEPVHFARPSVDVLFESAADAYQERVVGVILTGANADGSQGLACIKRNGGLAVVQDPSTAEAPAMPEAAIQATTVDRVLPLAEIGEFLNRLEAGDWRLEGGRA